MEMFAKKNQIESLQAIQNKIATRRTALDTLNAEQDAIKKSASALVASMVCICQVNRTARLQQGHAA